MKCLAANGKKSSFADDEERVCVTPELATELVNATSVMQSLYRVHVENVVHARENTEVRGTQRR